MENIVRTAQERVQRLERTLELSGNIVGKSIEDKRANNTEYLARYRAENPERIREGRRRRYHDNPEKDREWRKNGLNRLRSDVLGHYGGVCAMCGEQDMDILMVIWNGEGVDPFKSSGGSTKRYREIRKAGYPEGYVVKCHNCNVKTRRIGRVAFDEAEAKAKAEEERIDKLSDTLELSQPA